MIVRRIFLLYMLQYLIVSKSDAMHDDPRVGATNQVYQYRLLNWCISGRGEYTLNEWPLSQFKPILHQTYKNELHHQTDIQDRIDDLLKKPASPPGNVDPWSQFDLQISPISCAALTGSGMGDASGNFLQRIHIQFKPTGATPEIHFQGLMIQAVHAPFGLGFPFGVFDTNQEFECEDCKFYHFSKIVGCLSRPDFATMHPTLAMYHYKLRANLPQPQAPGATGPPPAPVEQEVGYRRELHWNFKWGNLPCSSARLVEFWVLMVIDFERRAWTAKKFGPYDLNAFTYASQLETPVTYTIGAVDLVQPGLPTPIIPDCYPFKKDPLMIATTGIFKGRPSSCLREFKAFDPKKCESWERKVRLVWAGLSPPPAIAIGAGVHTVFQNQMKCEASAITPTVLTKTRVRLVGDFDVQCTRRYPGKLYETMFSKVKRQPHKVCPEWQGRFKCGGEDKDLQFDINVQDGGVPDADRAFPGSHCTTCQPVTEEITQEPNLEEPFIKRAEHGIFMIYAFFFFNPVSLNVARFYKETLHEKQTKGWRLWLIIHVGFAAFASMFSYIGYTYPTFQELDAHITLGYGAMIGVSSGVLTGWFRHKRQSLQTCMFYLHALSGYMGWGLAIASMVFAPFISKWTRLVSYVASGICLFAMAVMTLHICAVDSNVGMRPKRSHIPIIEIRFDDVVPPKSLFRKIFLYLYIFIQFAVCFGMLIL